MNYTTVTAGAARLAVQSTGAGTPVVFLHANIADSRMWSHQLATLAPRYRAIAYDRRGFGNTPAVDEAHRPVDDLLAALDHVVPPGERSILVACSNGGSIALDATLAAPHRFTALILVSPSVSGSPAPEPHPAASRLLNAIDIAGKAGDLDEVNRLKAALFLDGPLAPEGRVGEPARGLFLQMNRIALAAQGIGRTLAAVSAWDRLGQIAMPVRILCGDLDIPHIQERCHQLTRMLPDASLGILPSAAHLPSLEQPEIFTARLMELLGELL